ncbi:hypothetical protein Tsubulata_030873 [Turnera subulata]|uniref:Uncharacterized protein n=1 Tax=Turnera subulata TaxID=218843 RepID=A0A9Q0J400_9ROSI|nr:hypothetical protein Tsubulata_030873 [Turnera subulata]
MLSFSTGKSMDVISIGTVQDHGPSNEVPVYPQHSKCLSSHVAANLEFNDVTKSISNLSSQYELSHWWYWRLRIDAQKLATALQSLSS